MELAALTAYAEEKYHIPEQKKWIDFPGFSVLTDPGSGKWLALLMRQWDQQTGQELERCDIKCGRLTPEEREAPFLSPPFRMKGNQWVGIRFDGDTDAETVFRLLDRAVYGGSGRGYTIVLDTDAPRLKEPRGSTPLLFTGAQLEAADSNAPDRILEMRRLYEYGDGSFAQKSKNFYRQGKFMEDYSDDQPWAGEFRKYFPCYHDLNVKQLRGYFTWRSFVRGGDYRPTAESFAYIYLYELLCGIGTASPEDSLQKLRAFEAGFLDRGHGSEGMRKNLRRWMLEFAILHDMTLETVLQYADPELLAQDHALAVLRHPEENTEGSVFDALCRFAEEKLRQSPAAAAEGGKRLFAAVWREAMEKTERGIFAECFGEQKEYPWHPLGNALHYEQEAHPAGRFVLDACRSYQCRGAVWTETRYDPLAFDLNRLRGLLHEADRQLRRYLKTGHTLREKREEAWAAPWIEAVLAAEEAARREAARPKINIDFTGLARIRRDAAQTRESLLTEAELEDAPAAPPVPMAEEKRTGSEIRFDGLDALHLQILLKLLHGEDAGALMRDRHLMPAVVADTINEAFLDELGDSVVDFDGTALSLIEDYREDVLGILGGTEA